MKVLVIGFGSIGKKHISVLDSLGAKISIVTSQSLEDRDTYCTITKAFQNKVFDLVIIATPTFKHVSDLSELATQDYSGQVLCEKPLLAIDEPLPEYPFTVFLGYNLRFSNVLQQLKLQLAREKVVNVVVNVGQYLPDWRPNSDYTTQYSAHKEQGGGVLRDLSHELDYCLWLFGAPNKLVAAGGTYSSLEIDSEDVVSIIMKNDALISINMNYLYRKTVREIMINTNTNTYRADLVMGQLWQNTSLLVDEPNDLANTYLKMHTALQESDLSNISRLNDGKMIMTLIDKVESSMQTAGWESL